jgi:hypothetical protein
MVSDPSGAAPSTPAGAQGEVVALWAHVRCHFENEAAHCAFLDACVFHNNLAFAAGCYRACLEEAEHKHDLLQASVAREQLEKVTGLAWSLLKSTSKPVPQLRRTTTWIGAFVCLVLLSAVALAFRG